ncbi:MAG TPA: Na+/H+ antiporter NhaC family protein [Candidatus Mucispirillum faecigallinarum]|uniref:Na+/H+ antiporter NhaC family protein n=1 Tax=Candidatus Mucispirillum faecigallinarum TaxID=2838699 RepID=A0A9D2GR13_9BACT|nr:Na+/H+ antiporter NhaC family protein [Candidatus Mucispirillum faecigallinarum]
MEHINVGFLSILPPIIAIVLALKSKDVVSSLIIGILSGTVIYVFNAPVPAGSENLSFFHKLILSIEYMFTIMADKFDVMMIIFMCVLGALVAVITLAGGARAYGLWAAKNVKSPTAAKLATSILGIVIFIDDYFNCLTVGTVMRPVTDQNKISREKLAYLIDAMAAPICIIAPISSWAASILTYLPEDVDRMQLFLSTIPYNFYALMTIVMVFMLSVKNLDFGPMAKFERQARYRKSCEQVQTTATHTDDFSNREISEKGKVYDLLIPILALIVFSVLAMLYTGEFFTSDKTLFQAFGDTAPTKSLVLGGFGALIVAFILFLPRKVLHFHGFMDGIVLGVKSMVTACLILTFAWTIKGVCDILSTGAYVSHLVETSNMPVMLIPAIVFLVAALLSFSIGTSWGTFGILIPIMVTVSTNVSPELLTINLAATLAGSVFGDHCSPISDTTILSSTGAACSHIDHVTTQIPYATLVAVVSLIGFIIAGISKNWILSFGVTLILLIIILNILHRRNVKLYGDE